MEEYKSNSHKSKQQETLELPEKRVDKAIVSGARVRKKSEARKLVDVFIPEDVEKVKSHIIFEVLIPSAKKAVYDMVTNGIEMILYGESGAGTHRSGTSSKISYRQFYDDRSERRTESPRQLNSVMDYEDIVVDHRGEAESILERLDELVSMYGMASVADMYDLVGITAPYTANKYGWTDIRNAKVVRIQDGYAIKMPRVRPLN